MTTSRLPFAIHPKPVIEEPVGNQDCGVLNIKRLNDLSPNERRFIKEHTKDLPNIQQEAVRLAQRIAEEIGESLVSVYNAIVTNDSQLLGDYLGDLLKFQDLLTEVTSVRAIAMATAILKFRVAKGEWTIEDSGNADLIAPELLGAIAAFASKEENGWEAPKETETESEPLTEEVLGESSTAK
jgi:hypothetical protein